MILLKIKWTLKDCNIIKKYNILSDYMFFYNGSLYCTFRETFEDHVKNYGKTIILIFWSFY